MIYFISGHRDINYIEFNNLYKATLDKIINKSRANNTLNECTFVIGDYHGVDILAQNYLCEKGLADHITVYHMGDKPMNINPLIKKTVGGFTNDIARDSAMTRNSDFDIAFVRKDNWKSGTAQNIMRRAEF